MEHKDFEIGQEFIASAGFRWLCTDKGTRTITAIMLDHDKDKSWFIGPPYAVDEVIFDEHDMKFCYSNHQALIVDRVDSFTASVHPGFDGKNFTQMFKSKHFKNREKYPHSKVLRRDRIGKNGEIWHPYAAYPIENNTQETENYASKKWMIQVFEIFARTWAEIHEDDFILLPYSNEEAMRTRKLALENISR